MACAKRLEDNLSQGAATRSNTLCKLLFYVVAIDVCCVSVRSLVLVATAAVFSWLLRERCSVSC